MAAFPTDSQCPALNYAVNELRKIEVALRAYFTANAAWPNQMEDAFVPSYTSESIAIDRYGYVFAYRRLIPGFPVVNANSTDPKVRSLLLQITGTGATASTLYVSNYGAEICPLLFPTDFTTPPLDAWQAVTTTVADTFIGGSTECAPTANSPTAWVKKGGLCPTRNCKGAGGSALHFVADNEYAETQHRPDRTRILGDMEYQFEFQTAAPTTLPAALLFTLEKYDPKRMVGHTVKVYRTLSTLLVITSGFDSAGVLRYRTWPTPALAPGAWCTLKIIRDAVGSWVVEFNAVPLAYVADITVAYQPSLENYDIDNRSPFRFGHVGFSPNLDSRIDNFSFRLASQLTLFYNFDEGQGWILNDGSGNKIPGKLIGMSYPQGGLPGFVPR